MIYRWPGFLAVVWFGSSPTPFPSSFRQQVVSLSKSSHVSPVKLIDGRRGRWGWTRSESYDRKKAWSSINHSTLSGSKPQHVSGINFLTFFRIMAPRSILEFSEKMWYSFDFYLSYFGVTYMRMFLWHTFNKLTLAVKNRFSKVQNSCFLTLLLTT